MLRIVRVGGSLLTWDGLPTGLVKWLDRQHDGTTVLIAGGGSWVDLVRKAALRFDLNENVAHWTSVGAMGVTAQLLHGLLADSMMCSDLATVRRLIQTPSCSSRIVLEVESFLRDEEPSVPGRPLPRNWDVTSDSIAARVAEALGAEELVLLKSASAKAGSISLKDICEQGYVDRHFAVAGRPVPCIRCVNLRAANWDEWSPGQGVS